jgi:hypothetical protein
VLIISVFSGRTEPISIAKAEQSHNDGPFSVIGKGA